MGDKLEEITQLEDVTNEIFVVYVKPKNKNKVVVYDTGSAAFDIVNNMLVFDFWEYKSFKIDLNNIKDVSIERFDDNMTIAYILLKNGNTIMIHFMN